MNKNNSFFEDDFEDEDTTKLILVEEEEEETDDYEYSWANFNAWYLIQKTDRWDTRNYYPTDWEVYQRENNNQ